MCKLHVHDITYVYMVVQGLLYQFLGLEPGQLCYPKNVNLFKIQNLLYSTSHFVH